MEAPYYVDVRITNDDKEKFLDKWYELNPESFMVYYEEFNSKSTLMLNNYRARSPRAFFQIWNLIKSSPKKTKKGKK